LECRRAELLEEFIANVATEPEFGQARVERDQKHPKTSEALKQGLDPRETSAFRALRRWISRRRF